MDKSRYSRISSNGWLDSIALNREEGNGRRGFKRNPGITGSYLSDLIDDKTDVGVALCTTNI